MPQLATATADYGDAYYLLTGADDFSYTLDRLVFDETLTQDQANSLRSSSDGYRLKFSILNNPLAVNANTDDTNAICFYSANEGEGAMCAGVQYNGSSMVSYAYWVNRDVF